MSRSTVVSSSRSSRRSVDTPEAVDPEWDEPAFSHEAAELALEPAKKKVRRAIPGETRAISTLPAVLADPSDVDGPVTASSAEDASAEDAPAKLEGSPRAPEIEEPSVKLAASRGEEPGLNDPSSEEPLPSDPNGTKTDSKEGSRTETTRSETSSTLTTQTSSTETNSTPNSTKTASEVAPETSPSTEPVDPIAAPLRALLAVFASRDDLRFPGIDATSLASAADRVRALAAEVERARAELATAESVLRTGQSELSALFELAHGYARVFARTDAELAESLDAIALHAPESKKKKRSDEEPRRRGRPPKAKGEELPFTAD